MVLTWPILPFVPPGDLHPTVLVIQRRDKVWDPCVAILVRVLLYGVHPRLIEPPNGAVGGGLRNDRTGTNLRDGLHDGQDEAQLGIDVPHRAVLGGLRQDQNGQASAASTDCA